MFYDRFLDIAEAMYHKTRFWLWHHILPLGPGCDTYLLAKLTDCKPVLESMKSFAFSCYAYFAPVKVRIAISIKYIMYFLRLLSLHQEGSNRLVKVYHCRDLSEFAIGVVGDIHLEPDQMHLFHRAREQLQESLDTGQDSMPRSRLIQLGDLGGYSHGPGTLFCHYTWSDHKGYHIPILAGILKFIQLETGFISQARQRKIWNCLLPFIMSRRLLLRLIWVFIRALHRTWDPWLVLDNAASCWEYVYGARSGHSL